MAEAPLAIGELQPIPVPWRSSRSNFPPPQVRVSKARRADTDHPSQHRGLPLPHRQGHPTLLAALPTVEPVEPVPRPVPVPKPVPVPGPGPVPGAVSAGTSANGILGGNTSFGFHLIHSRFRSEENRMHPAFRRQEHRPWPCPSTRWTWRQSWQDVLFAHWPVPAARLRHLVPEELSVQEFDGTSWVGVVPFRMAGVMRRPWPDLPWISAFPELNLRLYVERDGRPGVWFLSLDAANPLAVWAARRFFHLPYFPAAITLSHDSAGLKFSSRRRGNGSLPAVTATYRPASAPFEAAPGTLDAFLVERYCLYARARDGRLFRAEVHHLPWPLQRAEGEIDAIQLLAPLGLAVDDLPPLLHFSRGVDVVVWPLEPLSSRR